MKGDEVNILAKLSKLDGTARDPDPPDKIEEEVANKAVEDNIKTNDDKSNDDNTTTKVEGEPSPPSAFQL